MTGCRSWLHLSLRLYWWHWLPWTATEVWGKGRDRQSHSVGGWTCPGVVEKDSDSTPDSESHLQQATFLLISLCYLLVTSGHMFFEGLPVGVTTQLLWMKVVILSDSLDMWEGWEDNYWVCEQSTQDEWNRCPLKQSQKTWNNLRQWYMKCINMLKNEYEPASSLYSRIRWTPIYNFEATQIWLVIVCSILASIPLFQETLSSNQNLKGYSTWKSMNR